MVEKGVEECGDAFKSQFDFRSTSGNEYMFSLVLSHTSFKTVEKTVEGATKMVPEMETVQSLFVVDPTHKSSFVEILHSAPTPSVRLFYLSN